ncbi:MAG: hypothetical protein ACYC6Y_13010 [Thermoguttaceae bacterium]
MSKWWESTSPRRGPRAWALVLLLALTLAGRAVAQLPSETEQPVASAREVALPEPAATVEVNPVTRDEEIARRLERILRATEWFDDPQARTDEGVVFLTGRTPS